MDSASTTERDQTSTSAEILEKPSRLARAWSWLSGEEGAPRKGTVASWAALAVVWALVTFFLVQWDFREAPRAGDENNWIVQAQSLAYDRDLSFDVSDIAHWEALDWQRTPTPQGIFFRTNSEGYSVGKPYGYSLWLAPFVRTFGPPVGIAIGNAALLTALLAVALAILRTRLKGAAVPLLAGVFVFASYVYFYAFTTAVDLFLAFVTAVACLGFVRAWKLRSPWWAALGAVATAIALGDRITVGFALIPALVVVVIRLAGHRRRAAVAVVGVVAYALAVFPFLYYSDYEALSPYAQPRYHTSTSGVPWAIPVDEWTGKKDEARSGAEEKPDDFTPSGVWSRITGSPEDVPEATAYFFVGEHTGLLAFIPLALVTLLYAAFRWRRLDGIALALLAGVLGYSALYLVMYTDNFYGGGHSLGNRYFLQIAPLLLGVLASLRPSGRVALAIAVICSVVSLTFLWPHHADPESAYLHIDRTTGIQRLLLFEHNQRYQQYFRCAQGYGWAPPCFDVAR